MHTHTHTHTLTHTHTHTHTYTHTHIHMYKLYATVREAVVPAQEYKTFITTLRVSNVTHDI